MINSPPAVDYQGFNYSALNQQRSTRRLSFSDLDNHNRLLVALVGLPARGKSYLAKKIMNFALWRGHAVKVFNVGAYRRLLFSQDHAMEFFDPDKQEMKELREKLAQNVLKDAIQWLNEEKGQIAIFDATNTTRLRRELLRKVCELANVRLLFLESICDDKEILRSNLLTKIAKSPDYVNMNPETAIRDLESRIELYTRKYETIDDEENVSYIKLINLQSKIVCYHIRGYFPRLLVFFITNLRVNRRPIWLTRSGHCTEINKLSATKEVTDWISSNDVRSRKSQLSETGIEYARRLAKFVETYKPEHDQKWDSPVFTQGDYLVWTSTLRRAVETVACIPKSSCQWNALNMIEMGEYDNMTIEELQQHQPDVYNEYKADMRGYRFLGGESYNDVSERLEPLVMDLESQLKPVLVVSHLSCLRVLYAYFQGSTLETLPETPFPKHEVIEFTPTQYGWQEKRFKLMEEQEWACGPEEYPYPNPK
jgi:broad specificity phosphatase PhoE/predicted kinase